MKSRKPISRLVCIIKVLVFASILTGFTPFGFAQEDDDIVTLQQFEVRGFRDSLLLSRQEARNSLSLKDVIAADAVGKLPDSNIAEEVSPPFLNTGISPIQGIQVPQLCSGPFVERRFSS